MTEINTKYDHNTFARGFILFDNIEGRSESIKESKVNKYLAGWEKTFFGPTQLWYDKRVDYASASSPKHAVGVLGLCLNPFDGSNDNKVIAEKLYDALCEDINSFYSYLDQLSGSFVILFRENASVRILQDCAATRTVYYSADEKLGTIASSHANLIALPFGLARDERASIVYQNNEYKKDPSRYLPGTITPYENLYALTANTLFDFTSREQKRFFPRENLPPQKLNRRFVREVASIFRQQAKMIAAKKRPMAIATTAGRDSRVSVAAFSRYQSAFLFSFHIASSGHLSEDTSTAKLLADKLGKELRIFDLGSYKNKAFDHAFSMTSPNGIWPAAAQCYIEEFPEDTIHIRSTVSEIGRMFYSRRLAKSVTAEGLAQIYTVTRFGIDPLVISAMRDFIERSKFSTEHFYDYDLHDLFYWEHRNSKWQNILCMEAEMASDVFIPFNNRKLILLFLGLPEKDRKSAALHIEITKEMCPKVSKIAYTS